jgi:nitroreductase
MNPAALDAFRKLIRGRITVERFDTTRSLDDAEIRELIEDATLAPSSFNIQHWRFVAVRSKEGRARLCRAAFGQPQVEEAPLTFIVLGDLRGAERLPELLDPAVASGVMAPGKAEAWMRMAREIYADERVARDEALRSTGLAAMTLMLAAEVRGLASSALSGFDPELVARGFGIDERYLPVLLLAVGYPATRNDGRMPRLGVDEVLAYDHGRDL